jgi:hypothetical protein
MLLFTPIKRGWYLIEVNTRKEGREGGRKRKRGKEEEKGEGT